jgi:hypothetical protein
MCEHRHIDVDPRSSQQVDRFRDVALDRLPGERVRELLSETFGQLADVVLGNGVECRLVQGWLLSALGEIFALATVTRL